MPAQPKLIPLAARSALTRRHTDALRESIRAHELIDALQRFIFGEPAKRNQSSDSAPAQRMTREQVAAALGLLRKVLPDLASVEVEPGEAWKRMSDAELRERALQYLGPLGLTVEGQANVIPLRAPMDLTTMPATRGLELATPAALAVVGLAGQAARPEGEGLTHYPADSPLPPPLPLDPPPPSPPSPGAPPPPGGHPGPLCDSDVDTENMQ